MFVIPALDILNGQCVRLLKGDYNAVSKYSNSPIDVAVKFANEGASVLHIVDLDGAKSGVPINRDLIIEIVKKVSIPVQVGGGIRNFGDAKAYLDAGVNRVILGTAAVKNIKLLKELIEFYGSESIVVSLDFEDGKISIEGWIKKLEQSENEVLENLRKIGVKTLIVTDVSKDGTLEGMDLTVFKNPMNFGFDVIAAGGVSSYQDIKMLSNAGLYGAISGKAIYESLIDIKKLGDGLSDGLSDGLNDGEKGVVGSEVVPNGGDSCNFLAKRIIPCMDIDDGRVVKGTNFKNLKDAGDAVELAKIYDEMGADELVFLDISATIERRKTLIELVKKVAKNISIPFTVGGGIKTIADMRNLLNAGADKISIGSIAVTDPEIVRDASEMFGSQCVVISMDCRKKTDDDGWELYIQGGREKTGMDAVEFAGLMDQMGAGELLVNSLDRDGIKIGYDLGLLVKISSVVGIPVIASSGAGCYEDFLKAFVDGKADAALAASLFHYGEMKIPDLKQYLIKNNINIRL